MENGSNVVAHAVSGFLTLHSALFILHSSFEAGALTWTCTTNLRLRKAACRTDYTLRATRVEHLASVAGLAPARTGLKGRLRELLCIHGRNCSPRETSPPGRRLAGRH